MVKQPGLDWWRDQLFLATSEFLREPNDITGAQIKSLLKTYQKHFENQQSISNDEHERLMDYL